MGLSNTAKGLLKPVRSILEEKGLGVNADLESVNTEKANITDETLVRAKKTSNQSINSATWTTIDWDTEAKDERDEFDVSNNNFKVDETGWYWVSLEVTFVSPGDGDRHQVRIQNTTDGSSVAEALNVTGGANNNSCTVTQLVKLDSSKTYEAHARNQNSSDTLNGVDFQTNFSIRRAFR